MALITQKAQDAFLATIRDLANKVADPEAEADFSPARVVLLKNEVTSYDDIAAAELGTTTVADITSPQGAGAGARRIRVSTVQGDITISGGQETQASHYALIVETANGARGGANEVLATNNLSTPATVADGNNFTLNEFDITIAQPA